MGAFPRLGHNRFCASAEWFGWAHSRGKWQSKWRMNSKILLGVSVTLNLVALGFFVRLHDSRSASPDSRAPAAATVAPVPIMVSTPEQPATISKPSTTSWVEALRDAHISEKVIADVAAANFEDRWHALALENQKKFDRGEIDQATLSGFDLQHDEEREKQMRATLGDEGFRRWDQTRELADLERSGVQLSDDESSKLYDLRRNLARKQLELDKARLQGTLTDEDAASQSSALYTQYNQDILKFLGDDRYAQMQNGGDTGVSGLARNLNGVNADDSQVSGMTIAQQQWNAQRNELDIQLQKGEVTAEDYQKQIAALDAQRDQEYQKVLGTNGFAVFQRNQNEQYQTLKRLGAVLGFTGNDVNNLYAMLQDYQTQVSDYRNRAQQLQADGQAIDWSAVDKALANYAQQTESALRTQLGDKFDKLKRSNVMPFER
jgi:hypothetical protein